MRPSFLRKLRRGRSLPLYSSRPLQIQWPVSPTHEEGPKERHTQRSNSGSNATNTAGGGGVRRRFANSASDGKTVNTGQDGLSNKRGVVQTLEILRHLHRVNEDGGGSFAYDDKLFASGTRERGAPICSAVFTRSLFHRVRAQTAHCSECERFATIRGQRATLKRTH